MGDPIYALPHAGQKLLVDTAALGKLCAEVLLLGRQTAHLPLEQVADENGEVADIVAAKVDALQGIERLSRLIEALATGRSWPTGRDVEAEEVSAG